ncbi:iron-sulfur cluster assembly accessory protein [Pyruvatibacter mobilis]|jgi:iron-sulfur cluster assembly protein|uniref:HesB/IscA family protein n=1 Tax=Pyruvatibacter mobilis TaxID=1712261 RepID=UPI00041EBBA9
MPGNVITLTDKAADRIKAIIAKSDKPILGVRLGLENAGCAGMAYKLDYAEEKAPLDEVVTDKGVTILVDPKAILFLLGTEMDYEETKLRSGFVFNNPNETDACGCGESVTLKAAEMPVTEQAPR